MMPAAGMTAAAPVPSLPDPCSAIHFFQPFQNVSAQHKQITNVQNVQNSQNMQNMHNMSEMQNITNMQNMHNMYKRFFGT
jgi:hypothetical protein